MVVLGGIAVSYVRGILVYTCGVVRFVPVMGVIGAILVTAAQRASSVLTTYWSESTSYSI